MTPIEMALNGITWEAVPGATVPQADDLPHVTHTGVLRVAGLEIEVCQLSDGRRVISAEGMEKFSDWLGVGLSEPGGERGSR